MLFVAASVHGVGMREPLDVVFLDRTGRVVARRMLRPGRILVERRAGFAVELPAGAALPPVGARLALRRRPKLAPCREGSSSVGPRSGISRM